jgi:hypothetical protein
MQGAICYPGGFELDREWRESGQSARRGAGRSLSERDRMQDRRDPLPFRGDGEPDAQGTRPPLAWTVIWGGTYSNLYGEYIPKDTLRWGYVFWDTVRLAGPGVWELLEEQWEDEWSPLDPRDFS